MSVQFGKWNFEAPPSSPIYMEKVRDLLRPYAEDGLTSYEAAQTTMLYGPLRSTAEPRTEIQPFVGPLGEVITWDGRLDNRQELIDALRGSLGSKSSDVSIVAAAYECWDTKCFARLLGDWAIAIWDPREHSVLLAKDCIGARHLFYFLEAESFTWSTVLDPLVLLAGRRFALEREYVAGWMSFFPATHLTPYAGVFAVPPACFIRLHGRTLTTTNYWKFDPGRTIRYRNDSEYEEHFRDVFGQAVQRRLRSDTPILAELSGGVDSSSIVCMADALMRRRLESTPRLDTVSYFSDSEPNWNERAYFTKVEEKRGRAGCHIDVSTQALHLFESESTEFAVTPAAGHRTTKAAQQLKDSILARGNRVILSGMGGDEVTGGIPAAAPQLADLLMQARWRKFASEWKAWALATKKPLIHLLASALLQFFPQAGNNPRSSPAVCGVWLQPEFVRTNRLALAGYPVGFRFCSGSPSFQDRVHTIAAMQRQVAHLPLARNPVIEKRYPFLDRCLLEFLCAIPMEQLVRPGRRRSLIRRAMREIVPVEILERRRKAFVSYQPIACIRAEWPNLVDITESMICCSLGIVNKAQFAKALLAARQGRGAPVALLMRTLAIELWLRNAKRHEVFTECA